MTSIKEYIEKNEKQKRFHKLLKCPSCNENFNLHRKYKHIKYCPECRKTKEYQKVYERRKKQVHRVKDKINAEDFKILNVVYSAQYGYSLKVEKFERFHTSSEIKFYNIFKNEAINFLENLKKSIEKDLKNLREGY